MNVEDVIRERHAFEDRVRTFLEIASVMDDREIEIALARLVDLHNTLQAQGKEDGLLANILVKGELLRHYYGLRKQGVKSERYWKRSLAPIPSDPAKCLPTRKGILFSEPWQDYFPRCIAEIRLFNTPQVPPSTAGSPQTPIEMVKLLSP